MLRFPFTGLFFLLLFLPLSLSAQLGLTLFTDCNCNQTLLKQRLNYVNHTIDPTTAQVHLLITTQWLGSRGLIYKLQFSGQEELEGNSLTFELPIPGVMTSAERDEALVDRIELALAGFIAGTDYASLVQLNVDAPDATAENAAATANPEADSWDNWIFEIFANLSFNQQSLSKTSDFRSGMRIDRSTPELRIRINPFYSRWSRTVTTQDGEEINSFRKRARLDASVVKSLSDHWSVGLFASAQHHSFINIDLGTWVAPAIEYSFFSYDEVPFKEFTAAYRLGWVFNDYLGETVFLQTSESLARHILDVDLRLRQKWGNVFAGLTAGAYLNDPSMNRFSIDGRCDVRIVKGLSLNLGGSYEIINDQINLPRGDASLEDILLGQTQVATNFAADFRFGLSYTFGSLYNNVVNTRL